MDKGTLDADGRHFDVSDDGYELHTARANVDLREGVVQRPGAK